MKLRKILFLLFLLTLAVSLLYVVWGLNPGNAGYNVPRRLIKLAAIFLTGAAIGYSTIVFQTVVGNRILTPAIMGLDSLYLFVQTLVVFVMGAKQLAVMSKITDFFISVCIMAGFSLLLYRFVFKRENTRLFVIIFIGMMLGSLFSSLATFMQVIIDPNEFMVVQARMFASFNNVNTSLLGIAFVFMACAAAMGIHKIHQLDVLSLGRDIAVGLGVDYQSSVKKYLLIVSVMIAVSTALVGPITFLGLLAANLARQLLSTYKHSILIPGAVLIAGAALVGGQFMAERVFALSTPISVIINFIGGIYFIILLIREGRM